MRPKVEFMWRGAKRVGREGVEPRFFHGAHKVIFLVFCSLFFPFLLHLQHSGWMSDFGEYLPFDGQLFEGDAHDVHNRFPELWAGINQEAIHESPLHVSLGQAGDVSHACSRWIWHL